MKAITCSQCGAVITEINARTEYVKCIYCGSRTPLVHKKLFEISRREAEKANRLRRQWQKNTELEKEANRERTARDAENHYKWMVYQILFLIAVIVIPVVLYYLFNSG